ncbi:MAG TPA: ABC transporter permease [Burkholderiaceae bacterium]|jgi:hypothetical protein
MRNLHCLLAIVRADLTMRLRSPRFWIVLGLLLLGTLSFFPSPDQGYLTASVNGHYRANYSSAWVGMIIALMISVLLSVAGFYVIRGTVTRDIESRVWQLMVVTTMTRRTYLFAKWFSHVLVLLLMSALCLAAGLAMQWVRAEDRSLDLLQLIKPLLVITLPMLAMTAACAVWFDLLPLLRRTAGNVIFFFLWVTSLSLGAAFAEHDHSHFNSAFMSDPSGIVLFVRDLDRTVAPQLPERNVDGFCLGCGLQKDKPEARFTWQNWQPRLIDLPARALWLVLALLAVAAAAPLLDWAGERAGPAVEKEGRQASRTRPLRLITRVLAPLQATLLGRMLSAEILLTLRQRRTLWWLAAFSACLMQILAPLPVAALGTALSWMLWLDILAHAGLRDEETGTGALVFTAPGAVWRILTARWLTLVVLLWLATLPAMLRFAPLQPYAAVAVLLIGVSLASWGLAFGALWRNARPFEIVLCALAYHAMSGGVILNVATDPLKACILHATALPIAIALLIWRWPRLVRP